MHLTLPKPENSYVLFLVYPKFTSTPGDLVTSIGDDVHFNCSASGHPKPVISFRKENVVDQPAFVNERRLGLNGNTFIIKNVSNKDVGLYRCSAKSEAGAINTTFTLNVIGLCDILILLIRGYYIAI